MPQMADITVKKADGTTNVVYVALTPSAGDKVPARWRLNAVSPIPNHRPTVEIVARDNGTKDGRRLVMSGKYPVIATESGTEVLKAIVPVEISMLIPQNVDAVQATEAVHQFGNLFVSALMRSSFVDGYSPT